MMNLTETQRQAVRGGEAVRIRDEGDEYVIVRADVFDRVQSLFYDGGEWSHEELRQLLAKSAEANGWNEPEMDAYDNYDEEAKKRRPKAEEILFLHL